MIVWNADLILKEHTDPAGCQTVGIGCSCLLCGPVDSAMPLVRFDVQEQPDYPHEGICGDCIAGAQRAIDHHTAEVGMTRISSPYRCSGCGERATPVVWFNVQTTQEQYICARCLVVAQRQILVLQQTLGSWRKTS